MALVELDTGVKNREPRDLKVRDLPDNLEPRGLAEIEGRTYASLRLVRSITHRRAQAHECRKVRSGANVQIAPHLRIGGPHDHSITGRRATTADCSEIAQAL